MWWMAVVGAANGLLQGSAAREQAKLNNRLSKVNAEAANKVRGASNAAAAAEGSLARWVQSVNNQRQLDSGGDALEANVVNYRRQSDAGLTQDFASSIREAEQAGAAAAAQAVSGIAGNVTDTVNASMALRNSIVQQQVEDFRGFQNYDTARRAGSIYSQMIGGMDNSLIFDALDHNVDVANVTPVMSHWANAIQGAAASMGVGGQGTDVMRGPKESFTTEAGNGLQLRKRSSSNYDLADHAFDNKVKFGFNIEDSSKSDSSPYEIGGTGVKLGDNDNSTASIYSLWSK
jgi:hypothetical protein